MTENEKRRRGDQPSSNQDPITGAPGAHPVGTGLGAAGGAAAGAAIGAAGGPAGSLIGGAIGAIAGGLAGKGAAEAVNPTVEDAYWREHFRSRPYVDPAMDYEQYAPAYRYGWESRGHFIGSRFDDVEAELGREWDRVRVGSNLGWDNARHAARDAWDRIERASHGDPTVDDQ